MYQTCSLILNFHLLIPEPANKISAKNRQSKSVYCERCVRVVQTMKCQTCEGFLQNGQSHACVYRFIRVSVCLWNITICQRAGETVSLAYCSWKKRSSVPRHMLYPHLHIVARSKKKSSTCLLLTSHSQWQCNENDVCACASVCKHAVLLWYANMQRRSQACDGEAFTSMSSTKPTPLSSFLPT